MLRIGDGRSVALCLAESRSLLLLRSILLGLCDLPPLPLIFVQSIPFRYFRSGLWSED